MSDKKDFYASMDTEPIDINTFFKCASKDLDGFVTNIKHLESFKDAKLSLFDWYRQFGFWNESLNFIKELWREKGEYCGK